MIYVNVFRDFFLRRLCRYASHEMIRSDETVLHISWWRHQMEAFPLLLDLCEGNSPVTGEFLAQRPVMRSFDVILDLRLNERLSKQSWGWWFEMPSHSLWRHCSVGFLSYIFSWNPRRPQRVDTATFPLYFASEENVCKIKKKETNRVNVHARNFIFSVNNNSKMEVECFFYSNCLQPIDLLLCYWYILQEIRRSLWGHWIRCVVNCRKKWM